MNLSVQPEFDFKVSFAETITVSLMKFLPL